MWFQVHCCTPVGKHTARKGVRAGPLAETLGPDAHAGDGATEPPTVSFVPSPRVSLPTGLQSMPPQLGYHVNNEELSYCRTEMWLNEIKMQWQKNQETTLWLIDKIDSTP